MTEQIQTKVCMYCGTTDIWTCQGDACICIDCLSECEPIDDGDVEESK